MNLLLNPKESDKSYQDERTAEIMAKTIAFFEEKGLCSIKEDDQFSKWYDDFIKFIEKEEIFATLLTPSGYGDNDARFDLVRICEFSELLAFYSFSYQYCFQVTILGLGPIWMGQNEEVKHKTAQLLKEGAIFAFGLSEREHGADLYSNEMKLIPQGDGTYQAEGNKYYIGNANKAALVSTAGKFADTDEDVYFVVESSHRNYKLVKKISTSGMRPAFVGEYDLINYPITNADILSTGKQAWDSSLSTINIGKFQLGFANIGICTHALYEAINHSANRMLYGHPVTEFPHIKRSFNDAYARIVAMKLYALRSLDYFRSASDEDRRYLLFNPIQKMKVTSEGMKVIDLLLDAIVAKGYEQETYFESAVRDIGFPARLEGTTHVNVAQVIKFANNYFSNPMAYPDVSIRDEVGNDSYIFHQQTGQVSKVRFPEYHKAYEDLDTPNVRIFREQIELFKAFMNTPSAEQRGNMDYMLAVGKMFTLIVYAQLIAENCKLKSVDQVLTDQIFSVMVRDFAELTLTQLANFKNATLQEQYLRDMLKTPYIDAATEQVLWENFVAPLNGAYIMNP